MVKRVAKRGANVGKAFLGVRRFRCVWGREVLGRGCFGWWDWCGVFQRAGGLGPSGRWDDSIINWKTLALVRLAGINSAKRRASAGVLASITYRHYFFGQEVLSFNCPSLY